jgi:hypothetical protein
MIVFKWWKSWSWIGGIAVPEFKVRAGFWAYRLKGGNQEPRMKTLRRVRMRQTGGRSLGIVSGLARRIIATREPLVMGIEITTLSPPIELHIEFRVFIWAWPGRCCDAVLK